MPSTVDFAYLFEKIGKMYIQIEASGKTEQALNEKVAELSRVAGEALRALEAFGYKSAAELIAKGRPWHVASAEEAPAEVVES